MVKKRFVLLSLIALFIFNVNSASSHNQITSKVCSATSKVCVSNVTNELTVKDDALLQACKDCCGASQINAPSSIVGNIKGCIPRCKKDCEKAYKKAIAKINKGM